MFAFQLKLVVKEIKDFFISIKHAVFLFVIVLISLLIF
ncbi:hypothetical protein EDF67_101162 [Sphingobacterium sp. JUb78]|nr:hypothetical protein [Sphingobacterium sp. JUb56]MCW2259494.1 hypothetical protein [Sphingobacterium kitahiroshimense]TCR14059.1 hypothetical protein EDF67_101162 [Sphingobacterium sp. JUb78]